MAPPSVSWVTPTLVIKQENVPTDFPTGQSDRGYSSVDNLFSQMRLGLYRVDKISPAQKWQMFGVGGGWEKDHTECVPMSNSNGVAWAVVRYFKVISDLLA